MEQPLLRVQDLSQVYPVRGGFWGQTVASVKAVGQVSFTIAKGQTLGLVGESGCGKTTLGRTLLRLIEPTAGKIYFDGIDITTLGPQEMRKLRRRMQIIFQDPFAALNPRMKVVEILTEPLLIHRLFPDKKAQTQRLYQLLDYVQLSRDALAKYPHEFSGGQRQRICIARALAVDPEFIVCDEPVSALDVSVQAQVINLLLDLQKELGLTYLFIAHDLKVVEFISHQVAVMYLGNIVEMGEVSELYGRPQHPYTKALISAIPQIQIPRQHQRIILQGDVPSPMDPPPGCHFHPRCFRSSERCQREFPQANSCSPTHEVRCHHPLGDE